MAAVTVVIEGRGSKEVTDSDGNEGGEEKEESTFPGLSVQWPTFPSYPHDTV
jgi:hypothetical protein